MEIPKLDGKVVCVKKKNHLFACISYETKSKKINLLISISSYNPHCVISWFEALRYKPEGRGFDSQWCHWNFFINIILPAALWPWGRLSL